jgi:hypothetical protein
MEMMAMHDDKNGDVELMDENKNDNYNNGDDSDDGDNGESCDNGNSGGDEEMW